MKTPTPEQHMINMKAINTLLKDERTPVIEACYDENNCYKVVRADRTIRKIENPELSGRFLGYYDIDISGSYVVLTMEGYQLTNEDLSGDLESDMIDFGSMVWINEDGDGESFIVDIHYMEAEYELDSWGDVADIDILCCDM